MIHFGEIGKNDSLIEQNMDNPIIEDKSPVSVEAAQTFWNKMFAVEEEEDPDVYDEMIAAIFNRSCEEFDFGGDHSSEIQDILSRFDESNWADFSFDEKNELIEKYKSLVAESLGLDKVPELKWLDEARGAYGYYDASSNTICLNKAYLNDSKEIANTIPHELRHAYQHMRAEKGETVLDVLYKLNFENYINPIQLADGKYLFFTDYQDQLVEAEARAYAKSYSEGLS